jgi:hemerythrin-like domain-containing protein
MDALQPLKDEHRMIERVLECLDLIAVNARQRQRLDAPLAREAMILLSSYADRCHHGKEEEVLFPLLEGRRGFSPGCGPTAVMRAEHQQGRMLLRGMSEAVASASAGDTRALGRFAQSAEEYASLMRAHIRKEENCLFPDIERVLSPDDHDNLLASYGLIGNRMGSETHDQLERAVHALADRMGAPHLREAAPVTCGCGAGRGGAPARIPPGPEPDDGWVDDTEPAERPAIPSGL